MTPAQSFKRELRDENPLNILAILLAREPGGSVGFFQKSSSSKESVFRPDETYIGFGGAGSHSYKGERDPFLGLKQCTALTMGYLSYESVRFEEPILSRCPGGFSQVTQDFTSAEFSVFQNFFIFDHRACELTFLTQGSRPPVDFESIISAASQLPARPSLPNSNAELQPEEFSCLLGSNAFKSGVRKLQEHIKAGDIFQAVLSERFETELNVTPFEVFQTLVEIGSSAYQFFYSTKERTVLGASPELLLSVQDGKLETHPIAGTRPRGKTEEEELKNQGDLLKDVKENAEHLMLVDLARNDLGRIARPGTVRVSERNLIKKFPSVMHIVSKVVGDLRPGSTPVDAFVSCFPAGTLSGAPKIRAMQLISEIEGVPRGFYGGAFFLLQPNQNLEACISIRSMEIVGNLGRIQAGAGIVMDSNPDSEYEEVLHKSRTLRRAVALSRLRKEHPEGRRNDPSHR